MSVLKRDIERGVLLEPAVASQLEIVKNHYEHRRCKTSWTEARTCSCNGECPGCGAEVAPILSKPERLLVRDERGVWDLVEMAKKNLKLTMTMDMGMVPKNEPLSPSIEPEKGTQAHDRWLSPVPEDDEKASERRGQIPCAEPYRKPYAEPYADPYVEPDEQPARRNKMRM
jgi:hypothetical protein